MSTLDLRLRAAALLMMLAAALLAGLMGPAAITALAAPGQLDPTFAGFSADGAVTETGLTAFSAFEYPKTLALQPDGKFVVAGRVGANLVVFRYQPNGQRDPAFGGGDGLVEIPSTQGFWLYPTAVALQSGGQIIVAGRTQSDSTNDASDFLLLRLTATGDLDTQFEGGGMVTTDFGGNEDRARAVLVLPDDRIVVCGSADIGGDDDFAVARYLPDGAPDTSFSDDGKRTIPFGNFDACQSLASQNDGKLLLAGRTYDPTDQDSDNFALARLEPNGALDDDSNDGGFSGDGKLITDAGTDENATAVVVQPDGRIVVLGRSFDARESQLVRYLPDGQADGSFGTGGQQNIPNSILFDLALQPDGKLLALGRYAAADGADFAFYRLLSNGDLDSTFDEDGILWADFGFAQETGAALALQPDGRLAALGWHASVRPILVRLWPDGRRDIGGTQTHDTASGLNEATRALVVQPDGSFLVAGEAGRPGSAHSDAFVTRFRADGQVDTGFGSLGTLRPPSVPFFPPDYRGARALALQADGKIVMGGYADWNDSPARFLIVRWNPDGTPDFGFGFSGWKLVDFPSNGDGDDSATALALAPDGKIVVAGNLWTGNSSVWGVARLTITGTLDTTFGPNHDGLATVAVSGANALSSVVVQPDGKIVIAGHVNSDFAVARLLDSGLPDTAFGTEGMTITDLGGNDGINALALASNGWLYAAGYHGQPGNVDMALAQYRPDGTLAECPSDPGAPACSHWPAGWRLVDLGGTDSAYALALRGDNQIVVAGCSALQMAAAQVSTTDAGAAPLTFRAHFAGNQHCAYGIQFSNAAQDKFIVAGVQTNDSDANIALARFETTVLGPPLTPTPTPSMPGDPYRLYLPAVWH